MARPLRIEYDGGALSRHYFAETSAKRSSKMTRPRTLPGYGCSTQQVLSLDYPRLMPDEQSLSPGRSNAGWEFLHRVRQLNGVYTQT